MRGINENYEPAVTLIEAAQEFLLRYVEYDGRLDASRHELAAAAADVVFSASYVDSEFKHRLLGQVHEKLARCKARGEQITRGTFEETKAALDGIPL